MVDPALATALNARTDNTFLSCIDEFGVSTAPRDTPPSAHGNAHNPESMGPDRLHPGRRVGRRPSAARAARLRGRGTADSIVNPIDFSKTITKAAATYFPEEGTDLEQVAMKFHAQRYHPSYKVAFDRTPVSAPFTTNGSGPVVGAPYNNRASTTTGGCWIPGGRELLQRGKPDDEPENTHGRSHFTSQNPRIYKGTFVQFDAILNKVGYHYPSSAY